MPMNFSHQNFPPMMVFKVRDMRLIAFIFVFAFASGAHGAELAIPAAEPVLRWNAKEQRFSAAIESLPLKAAMAKISAATGWKVFIDPAAEQNVSAQFGSRAPADALRLLLGNLNFAIVPQKGGGAKLLVFRNSAREATEAVEAVKEKGEHGKDWLKNEMIVSLTRGSKRNIDDLARELGAKIVARNDRLRTYRLQFDSEEAADKGRDELASSSDLRVDDNYALRPPDPNGNPDVSGPPGFDLKATGGPDASHTIVAVLDTALQGLDAQKSEFLMQGVDVAGATDPAKLASSVPMHGTSMVETILGSMAMHAGDSGESNIRILPVNVYGNNETTSTYEVTLGFYEAVKRGASVVNMSLGGDGDSPLLDNLIGQARQNGVLVFAAAGNTPTTAPTFPAANPLVYAVTASDRNGDIASYANRGSFVDLIAPGTSFLDFAGTTFRVSGTSPATATVSGAAAMYLSAGHSVQETEAQIQQTFGIKR